MDENITCFPLVDLQNGWDVDDLDSIIVLSLVLDCDGVIDNNSFVGFDVFIVWDGTIVFDVDGDGDDNDFDDEGDNDGVVVRAIVGCFGW